MKRIRAVLVPCNETESLSTLLYNTETLESDILSVINASNVEETRNTLLFRPTDDTPGLYALHAPETNFAPNVRATRLAMACGIFQLRLVGNVILYRTSQSDLSIPDVMVACCVSADLRESHVRQITLTQENRMEMPPCWLLNATRNNYHDGAALARLAVAMKEESSFHDDESFNDDDNSATTDEFVQGQYTFVTKVPLCLHCRKPAVTLCPNCNGAYFCDSPATCKLEGWSHDCLCASWRIYCDHRKELSTFSFGDDWYRTLVSRPFQTSQQPYEGHLTSLGMLTTTKEEAESTWWRTERDGWAGGQSESAQSVNVTVRMSYAQGFAPLTDFPPERRVTDCETLGYARNGNELIRMESWESYYALRRIPSSSPVALLLTFPCTLYYAIVEYGAVPCTVAHMLKRPLRIHIIGTEKELNFLDLFKEVVYLCPNDDLSLELVFVVRQDMLPPKLESRKYSFDLDPRLRIVLVTGTYGSSSLDPRFDCGSGPPDMIMAFNAGLYAYDSWRSVVEFLDQNKNVVGVFTDYNEFSGVQCASLGGWKSRESLRINPFRQPRAMPVYSMNLPQFSNGFIYVFNELQLE